MKDATRFYDGGDYKRGSQNHCSILTEARVRHIRRRFADGQSIASLAKRYGVAYPTAYNVCKRRSWIHV